jgi:hypothetical protein
MRILPAIMALSLATGCNLQSPPVATTMGPDEIDARAWCQDAMATDVRYAGSETIYDSCVYKFLHDRKRGWR